MYVYLCILCVCIYVCVHIHTHTYMERDTHRLVYNHLSLSHLGAHTVRTPAGVRVRRGAVRPLPRTRPPLGPAPRKPGVKPSDSRPGWAGPRRHSRGPWRHSRPAAERDRGTPGGSGGRWAPLEAPPPPTTEMPAPPPRTSPLLSAGGRRGARRVTTSVSGATAASAGANH